MEETIATAENVAETPVEAEAAPQKKKKKPINQQKLQDNLWGWLFCVPLLIGTIWFVYVAFIMALIISFGNYDIGGSSGNTQTVFEFLANFKTYVERQPQIVNGMTVGLTEVSDPLHWYKLLFTTEATVGGYKMNEMGAYLFNTVFYMIGIPIGMVLSVFFAVCMSRDIKGGNLFRVLYYIPCVASSISIVFTFRIMFQPTGVMNSLFGSEGFEWISGSRNWADTFGLTTSNEFLKSTYWCQGIIQKTVIVIMSVWKGLGGTIILYVAGLSGVNAATKEAAQIDGANGWQIFWKVTMPDLYPTIFYNIVTSVIGGLQIYAEPVLFFEEGPLTSGYVSLIWGYGLNVAGNSANVGRGAAYGMFLAVIIFVLTLFQFWLDARKKD